jgi:hypothetical protein
VCRCQRHVKPPFWRRTRDLERSNFRHKRPPGSEATLANPAAEGGTMGEKWPRILPKLTTSTSLLVSFTCSKTRHRRQSITAIKFYEGHSVLNSRKSFAKIYQFRNKDSFYSEALLAIRQTPELEDHPPCRRSATPYSIYLQLSLILEAFPLSAT